MEYGTVEISLNDYHVKPYFLGMMYFGEFAEITSESSLAIRQFCTTNSSLQCNIKSAIPIIKSCLAVTIFLVKPLFLYRRIRLYCGFA